MKTLIVYELVPEETKFFMVEGDRSDLDGCIVNSVNAKKFSKAIQDEVSAAPWGASIETPFSLLGDTRVVHCGFIL